MSVKFNYFILLMASLLIACSPAQQQEVISVEGETLDLTRLAGQWEGEYVSQATNRKGSVSFNLDATDHSASGYIIMTVAGSGPDASKTVDKKVLTIDFVGMEGMDVRGDVTPYQDPAFDSIVFSNFEGTLNGEKLEGIFTARIEKTGEAYTGTWWAVRK